MASGFRRETRSSSTSESDAAELSKPSKMNGYTNGMAHQQNGYAYQNGHSSVHNGHGSEQLTNGHRPHDGVALTNGHYPRNGFHDRIASPEMGYYCFEVLYNSLYPQNSDPIKPPLFTNEALYVNTITSSYGNQN